MFWIVDMGIIGLFLAVVVFHSWSAGMAESVDWTAVDGFVNVYTLAELVRVETYLLAVTCLVVCIKTFKYLRVNRGLSTFISVIQGYVCAQCHVHASTAACVVQPVVPGARAACARDGAP